MHVKGRVQREVCVHRVHCGTDDGPWSPILDTVSLTFARMGRMSIFLERLVSWTLLAITWKGFEASCPNLLNVVSRWKALGLYRGSPCGNITHGTYHSDWGLWL